MTWDGGAGKGHFTETLILEMVQAGVFADPLELRRMPWITFKF
jgi:hypothetical protein